MCKCQFHRQSLSIKTYGVSSFYWRLARVYFVASGGDIWYWLESRFMFGMLVCTMYGVAR